MAIAAPTTPFVWGQAGAMKTPEQIARDREIAAALMNEGMDYSPVGHWLQGAARAAQGGVGALKERWAGEAETAGREGFQSRWDSVFGGGAAPVQTASVDPVAAALAGTPQTATDARAMMSNGASPSTPSPVSGDWLEYANQGATRNQPLAPELVSAMGFLPEMGVTMRVVSGGQDSEGPNRVGSTRHDHGNSGDVDFYQNGRKLDWNNQNDLPILSDIVARARSNGITGIGAGDDYMGAGRFHIGFGNEAVWGAGGKSENAPEWLRAAYNGAAVPTGGGSQSPLQMAQAPDMAALLGLASDPWANDAQRSIVESLMGQQMQQQDPMYQLQMRAAEQGLTKGDLEIQQLLNPAPPKPIEVGGVLLDPNTMQPIFDSRQPSDTGFTLSPGQQRFDAQGNPIATGGPEADKAPTVQKVTLADGSEMAVQWDGNTQAWVPINAPQGGGNLQPDGLTESQSKLTLFQTLQTETQPVLLDLEQQFNPSNLQDAAARSTPIAGNFFQSEQGQIYNASAKAWAEGALRIATGAAATPEEMERTLSTYFAQPGDTPNTIAFKAQLREMYNRAVNNSLGRQGEGQLPLPSEFAQQAAPSAAGGQAAPTGQSQPRVISQQDYQSLPSGSPFIAADDPTRTVRIKP